MTKSDNQGIRSRNREACREPSVIPLIKPAPPRLTDLFDQLAQIEASGVFTNYGPANTRFEHALVAELFAGHGHCVTMCNATIALMLALKQATFGQPAARRRYALMPSFTFAATAHAAVWAGLTPLLCDIDPETWLPCAASEQRLLDRYGDQLAVIVACTTFGNPIDLGRYGGLAETYGCGLVVDAAAALGTTDLDGRQFGTGAEVPIVFSMHATKAFATLEGAVIYSGNSDQIAELRAMGNFGFVGSRSASLPGLNAKLNEVTALLALHKLETFSTTVAHRHAREGEYRSLLPEFTFQRMLSLCHAPVAPSILVPPELAGMRNAIREEMLRRGVQTGAYFDPHLALQPYFMQTSVWSDLPVSDNVAGRVISLPMHDTLTSEDVTRVGRVFRACCEEWLAPSRKRFRPSYSSPAATDAV